MATLILCPPASTRPVRLARAVASTLVGATAVVFGQPGSVAAPPEQINVSGVLELGRGWGPQFLVVSFATADARDSARAKVVIDYDGAKPASFDVALPRAGAYAVQVLPLAYRELTTVGAETPVKIQVPPPADLHVVVTALGSGERLTGATVLCSGELVMRARDVVVTSESWSPQEATWDEQGRRYACAVPATSQRVEVRRRNFVAREFRNVAVAAERANTLVVELSPAGDLRVRVSGGDSTIGVGRVTATRVDDPLSVTIGAPLVDGECTFEDLEPGRYRVTLAGQGTLAKGLAAETTVVAGRSQDLELRVAPGK